MAAIPLWPDGHPAGQGEDPPGLTPFRLPGPAPSAAVVVCPGGGYRRRAAHEGEPVARWLNGLGVAAFVLDYRVAPHRHPAPLEDARRAIRTVRDRAAEWGVGPGRGGVRGFAAGGPLAAAAATGRDEG